MPRGVQASRAPPESTNRADDKSKMPDSSADDSPHRPAPQVAPTVLAGDHHRSQSSDSSRFASPSNMSSISKPRPRSDSLELYSDVKSSPAMSSTSFYGNKKPKDYGASSPARPLTPSTNMFITPKQQQMSNRGLNMVQASSLRTQPQAHDNIQRSRKWQAGTGKVEKGQCKEWKENEENRGEGEDWDTTMRSTYNTPVKHKGEVKFGQISGNKLGSGSDEGSKIFSDSPSTPATVNIDLTQAPSPPKVPKILEPHLIGFQNHGNTCYLNASLQALLGLPMMVTDAINLKYAVDLRKGSAEKPVKKDMMEIFLQIARARENKDFDKVTRKIDLLKTELEHIDKQFIGNKMQDANEFLSRLMDSMKDNVDQLFQELSPDVNEVKALVTEKEDGSKVELPNIVNSNFLSEREETFECMNCHSKESNRHRDLNFYCTVARAPKPTALGGEDRPVQLHKLVDSTFETNEVRERRCDLESCGHNAALTTNRLTRLPRVLVLHLKRYDFKQGEKSRKISRPVSLPAKLNLTKYIAEDVQLPEPVMERLCRREPVRAVTPQPPTISSSRKRSRVESDDETDNVSSHIKVQGVERLSSSKHCVTPVKFRGKTAEEVDAMGDDDKLEYTLHMSMKSIPETTNNNIEDQNLAAAIQASLNETPSKKTCDEGSKIFSDSPSTPATAAADKFNNMDVSEDKVEAPKTQAEEERQIQEALQLSLLEDMEDMDETDFQNTKDGSSSSSTTPDNSSSFPTALSSPSEIGESSNNNPGLLDNNNGLEEEEDNPGLPEHDYRLVSVVSHYGATTSSGHYVADVYRFDQGSWFRYDDTVVTPITETNVRNNGNNTKNGYIFMYIQEALAKQFDSNKTTS